MFEYPENDEDDDMPEKDDYFEKSNAFEFSMKLPVKTHLIYLEDLYQKVLEDQEISKNDAEVLHNKYSELEKKNRANLVEFMKGIEEKSRILDIELKKMIGEEENELIGLKKQASQLTSERIRLQQETIVLENRVDYMEKDLGFKHKLSALKKKK